MATFEQASRYGIPTAVAAALMSQRPELIRISAQQLEQEHGAAYVGMAMYLADAIEQLAKLEQRVSQLETGLRDIANAGNGIYRKAEAMRLGGLNVRDDDEN